MKMCTYCTQQRLAAVLYLYSITSGLFATLNPLKPCPKFKIHGCSHSGYETRIFRIYFRNINENKFFSCRQLSIKWSAFCSPSSRRLNCRPSNWLPCIKPYQCQISLEMEATILGILLNRGGRLKFLSEHLSFIKSWTSSFWQKWRDWRLEQGVPWTFGPNFCSYLKSIYDILKSFFSSATLILPVTTSKHSPPALLLNSEGCLPALEAPPVEQLPALLVSCWRCDVGSSSRRFLSWSLLLHNCCRLASVFLMSNVSSNSPLLQKCSFFKCAPPGTRLFL